MLCSVLDLSGEGVGFIREVLDDFELFGAQVGQRQDLVICGIEVKLVLKGQISFVFLDKIVEEFFIGEGVLSGDDLFAGGLVEH